MKASVELCINKLSDASAKSELKATCQKFDNELGELRTPDGLANSCMSSFARAPNDWQIDHPHILNGRQDTGRSEWTNYRSISFLSLPGREYAKMPRKWFNHSWIIPNAVFVAAVALQNKFPLARKFSRNPGSMPKTYTHVLSTSRKHTSGFLVKNFSGCCGSTVLTGASCWPPLHFCSEDCVPVDGVKSQPSSVDIGLRNGVCCHHPSS